MTSSTAAKKVFLPEVVNCLPHSLHLRGPSVIWIFKWALRFPTWKEVKDIKRLKSESVYSNAVSYAWQRQVCYLVEAFIAVRTFVAFLGVMRLQMSHLGGRVGEGLIAVVTLIRLFTAVHQLVSLQIARCCEELAAHVATIAGFTRVAFAVQVKETDLTVALSTSGAAVRFERARKHQENNLIHKAHS